MDNLKELALSMLLLATWPVWSLWMLGKDLLTGRSDFSPHHGHYKNSPW